MARAITRQLHKTDGTKVTSFINDDDTEEYIGNEGKRDLTSRRPTRATPAVPVQAKPHFDLPQGPTTAFSMTSPSATMWRLASERATLLPIAQKAVRSTRTKLTKSTAIA